MGEGKNVLRSIVELPSTIVAAIPNFDSDWARYGLPAVVLTVIFFFAMRFQAGKIDSSPIPSAATRIVRAPAGAKQSTGFSAADQARPEISTEIPEHEAAPAPRLGASGPAQSYALRPQNMTTTNPATQGRRALCSAVQYVMARVKKKHWKITARQLAIDGCRVPGGGQTAEQVVNSALADYGRGTWDESQCPPVPGQPPLAKGAIAEVMR